VSLPDADTKRLPVVVAVPFTVRPPICVPSPIVEEAVARRPLVAVTKVVEAYGKMEAVVDVAKKLPERKRPALVDEAKVSGVVVALFGKRYENELLPPDPQSDPVPDTTPFTSCKHCVPVRPVNVIVPVAVRPATERLPEMRPLPWTESVVTGVVVPIPRSPAASITIYVDDVPPVRRRKPKNSESPPTPWRYMSHHLFAELPMSSLLPRPSSSDGDWPFVLVNLHMRETPVESMMLKALGPLPELKRVEVMESPNADFPLTSKVTLGEAVFMPTLPPFVTTRLVAEEDPTANAGPAIPDGLTES
jgi:hypothetical protein